MNETTQNQIDEMKSFVKKLENNHNIKKAWIDDWGRFGNFTIMVIPEVHEKYSTTRLKAIIKSELKTTQAKMRDCFSPDGIKKNGKIIGYKRDYFSFDIDYMKYCKEMNIFL